MLQTHKVEGLLRNALMMHVIAFQRSEACLMVILHCALAAELVEGTMQLDELVTIVLDGMHEHCHVHGQASQQEGAHETLRLHPDGLCMLVARRMVICAALSDEMFRLHKVIHTYFDHWQSALLGSS
jgi:hypothetical protein